MPFSRLRSLETHGIALQPSGNIVDMPVHKDIVILEYTAPLCKGGCILNLNKGDIDDFIFGDDDEPYVSEK